jgi:hypothetical protein
VHGHMDGKKGDTLNIVKYILTNVVFKASIQNFVADFMDIELKFAHSTFK